MPGQEKPLATLRAEQLSKTYAVHQVETHALRGVDLLIEPGEFTAISGPSGSGKTTLQNLLGGLDSPSSGRVFLGEVEVTKLSQGELSRLRLHRLGFVFQSDNLIPVLSAIENVEYVMLLQGVAEKERRERAETILTEVGLQELIHQRPPLMSGGQQQRVAVARAMVSNPELVMADEPTANLDSKTAAGLLDLMARLNAERGITFLFSTHDPNVMARARRLIQLHDGRIARDEKKSFS